jgi:hypothetical protein
MLRAEKSAPLHATTSGSSVRQSLSAQGGTLDFFQLGFATDKRYSLGITRTMSPTIVESGEFEHSCARLLATRREQATQRLRTLFDQEVPAEVTSAEIQIFFQDDGGAPDIMMYFDGKNKRVSKSDHSIYPGRAMSLDLGLDVLSELEPQNTHAAANIVKRWLTECWLSVGGQEYPVAVALSIHDGWGDGKQVTLVARK